MNLRISTHKPDLAHIAALLGKHYDPEHYAERIMSPRSSMGYAVDVDPAEESDETEAQRNTRTFLSGLH